METQPNKSPAEKHEHASKEKGEHGPLDTIKKYIGLAAAVISLGSAIYGVLSYQADKRDRAHQVAELLAASKTQQSGRDYEGAWNSLQSALKIIDKEKGLVKLLGGLDKEQEQVETEQEDLAMDWLRAIPVPISLPPAAAPKPPVIPDPVLGVLSTEAAHASGSRKADLLAHLGWAYCLKLMNQPLPDQHPDNFFRQALAVEADNPYAKTFLGYCMVTTVDMYKRQEMAVQAQPYFVAALSSKRAVGPLRAWVREKQFSVFHVAPRMQRLASWWQAVNEMYKAKEPLDVGPLLFDLGDEYIANRDAERDLATFQKNLDQNINFAPIEEHVQLLHVLVDHTDANAPPNHIADNRLLREIALATALEKAGKPTEALAAWRDAQARKRAGAGDNLWHLDQGIDAAVARLSAAGPG